MYLDKKPIGKIYFKKSYYRYGNHSKASGDAKFQRTWLYRVGLNTAITYIKRGNRDTLAELQFSQESYCEITYREDIMLMYQAISRLTKVEKALVTLYLEDWL
jgi:RNA polymerase sigma-70 factor (ECF subfamily)